MEGDCTKTLLVTANVGSLFEEPETMFPIWLKAFFQSIHTYKPGLLAIHCQEVGGKNYEASMQHVNQFIKTLLGCEELHRFDRARIFLDEDYTASDKFTALGNIYFIHEEVSDVLIWDFVDCKFIEVEGREVLSGNIENVPIKEKAKFPQQFFPEFKWSRKGFLRTRWSINNCIFDLVNIHLFHDASNIVAMESSPSVYSGNRQRALLHTLQRFENDQYSKVPLYLFGDFNFRLDSNLLIQELTSKLVPHQIRGKKDQVNKIEYSEEGNGKVILTVESKGFNYHDRHADLFSDMNKWLHQFDGEIVHFRDRLSEFEINFRPSYPFCEDAMDGMSYMKTRVPSWCDRILLSHSVKDILSQDSSHQAVYDLIGKDVCMGDHKPVYLFVHIKPGKGNLEKKLSVESFASEGFLISERSRTRTLSINGEPIKGLDLTLTKVDLSGVNIHDYAVFEKEKDLLPEFKSSIKNRFKGEREINEYNNTQNSPKQGTKANVKRNKSFQEMARKVRQIEKVLIKWPRRSRQRHHSSSSEDFMSDSENDVDALGSSTSSRSSQKRKKDKDCKSKKSANETNNNEGAVSCQQVAVNNSNDEDVMSANLGNIRLDMIKSDSAVGASGKEAEDALNMNVVLLGEQSCDVHVGDSPHPHPSSPPSQNLHISDGPQPEEQKTGKQKPATANVPSSKPQILPTAQSSSSGCCNRCVVL